MSEHRRLLTDVLRGEFGFEKLHLDPGERRTVSVPIEERSFARYDEQDGWTVPTGSYTLSVERSSRDLRSRVSVTIG